MATFADAFKELRLEKNLTQKEYAKKLSKHYESFDCTQEELAEHLGVSINTLTSLLK